MRAIVHDEYGSPDRLQLREIDTPEVGDDGVLVRVRAASLNPLDWHLMRGLPYVVRLMEGLRRPKRVTPGVDLAGVVEAVGASVTEFRVGDEVFGARGGALAEYVRGAERNFTQKPPALTFEQAAAIPTAAVTALQGLRDRGKLEAGQRVLVNGAAGGVGTFAVQIAKALGADVTGVCSTRNIELVRSLGADHVIDYTVDDFARGGQRYDLMLDNVGNRSLSDCRRALTSKGTLVIVGAREGNYVAPIARPLAEFALSPFVGQRLLPFLAKHTKDDLLVLRELAESGKLTAVVDRTYLLSEAAEAMRHLETGHARGKVVVTV